MYTRHICVSVNEIIADTSPGNSNIIPMLSEFAEACKADGIEAVTFCQKKDTGYFIAGSYCGFAALSDGTLIEILPKTDNPQSDLCAEFCKRCGADINSSDLKNDMSFPEFFISVFAAETMKIIKSGVLSTYTTREENMTTVHGTIMFSENMRRNLVHRERLYVRHDVFTPDRAENRIIKAAASILLKITANSHSSHLLKEALSFLDEVARPVNINHEFAKCINTRNTKKYSTILNICRMMFDKNEGTLISGKNILCAQFYKLLPPDDKTINF